MEGRRGQEPLELDQADVDALAQGVAPARRALAKRLNADVPSKAGAEGNYEEKAGPVDVTQEELRALGSGRRRPPDFSQRLQRAEAAALTSEEPTTKAPGRKDSPERSPEAGR
jgi:hypothetical protein